MFLVLWERFRTVLDPFSLTNQERFRTVLHTIVGENGSERFRTVPELFAFLGQSGKNGSERFLVHLSNMPRTVQNGSGKSLKPTMLKGHILTYFNILLYIMYHHIISYHTCICSVYVICSTMLNIVTCQYL